MRRKRKEKAEKSSWCTPSPHTRFDTDITKNTWKRRNTWLGSERVASLPKILPGKLEIWLRVRARNYPPPKKKRRIPTPNPNLQTLKTTKFCGKLRHMKTPPPDDKQNDRTRIPERAKSRVKMVYLRRRWRKSVFIPIKFWILFINQQNKHLMGNKKRVEMRALYKKNILRKNLNQSPNLVYRICKLHFLIRRPPPSFSRNFSYSLNTLSPSPIEIFFIP